MTSPFGREDLMTAEREPVHHDESAMDHDDFRREQYGGMNIGAAFFGWLVAVALTVLLTGIAGAVVTATGWSTDITWSQLQEMSSTVGLATAGALLAIVLIAYYSGGYVAGRMSRFDGGKQGFAVWLIGIILTAAMVAVGALFGSQYDVFQRIEMPSFSVDTTTLTLGGAIAVVVVLLGTLLAAIGGGKVGTRYHRKIDNAF